MTQKPRTIPRGIVIPLAAVAAAGALVSQARSAEDKCYRPSSPDEGIAACTAQIESGRFKGKALAVKYFNRAVSWYEKGQASKIPLANGYFKAWEDYNRAIRLDPKHAQAYVNRAIIRMKTGGCTDALKDINAAVSISGPTAQNLYNRGLAYHCMLGRSGDVPSSQRDSIYRRMIADFDQAIRLKPDYLRAYSMRAWSYRNWGKPKQALAALSALERRDPRNPANLVLRGIIHEDLEQYDKAIVAFTRAIGIDPKYARAYAERARIYHLRLNDRAKAIADYRMVYRLHPASRRRIRAVLRRLGAEP